MRMVGEIRGYTEEHWRALNGMAQTGGMAQTFIKNLNISMGCDSVPATVLAILAMSLTFARSWNDLDEIDCSHQVLPSHLNFEGVYCFAVVLHHLHVADSQISVLLTRDGKSVSFATRKVNLG